MQVLHSEMLVWRIQFQKLAKQSTLKVNQRRIITSPKSWPVDTAQEQKHSFQTKGHNLL